MMLVSGVVELAMLIVEVAMLAEVEAVVEVSSASVLSENTSSAQLSGDKTSTIGYNAK